MSSPRLMPAAAELTAAVVACGGDANLLQIGSSICLPGYDTDLCMNIVRTGAPRKESAVYGLARVLLWHFLVPVACCGWA